MSYVFGQVTFDPKMAAAQQGFTQGVQSLIFGTGTFTCPPGSSNQRGSMRYDERCYWTGQQKPGFCPDGWEQYVANPTSRSATTSCQQKAQPWLTGTRTCYPTGLLSLVSAMRPGGLVASQPQPREVPINQPCPAGTSPVAPCPPGTRRTASLPGQVGQCEAIPCTEGFTRDSNGQCRPPSPVGGRCPGHLSVYPSRCSAPDGTRLVYKETCLPPIMEAPRGPGWVEPPPPACTAEQLLQGKYAGPTVPPKQTDCQTGYVLVNEQCVKQTTPIMPPAEVKTAGVTSWASANWKWLAALAVVGAVGYGWAKRKPVEA